MTRVLDFIIKLFVSVCLIMAALVLMQMYEKEKALTNIAINKQSAAFYEEQIELYKCKYYETRLKAEEARLQMFLNSYGSKK